MRGCGVAGEGEDRMSTPLSEFADKPAAGVMSSVRLLEGTAAIPTYAQPPTTLCSWTDAGARRFVPSGKHYATLAAGVYHVCGYMPDGRPIFEWMDFKTDALVAVELAQRILSEIESFWTLGERFRWAEVLHRRGYLLYGPAGCGKTSVVALVTQDVIARGGIVVLCREPKLFCDGLISLRQVEPIRPVVCVFEDIDAIVREYGEDRVLSVLDGEGQIDHVLNIATTNYPEFIDRRIVSRPRRFDRVIKVPMPDRDTRRRFIETFAQRLPDGSARPKTEPWIKATEGFSFAALTEALISVYCLDNPFDETMEFLRGLMQDKPSSEDFQNRVGFAR